MLGEEAPHRPREGEFGGGERFGDAPARPGRLSHGPCAAGSAQQRLGDGDHQPPVGALRDDGFRVRARYEVGRKPNMVFVDQAREGFRVHRPMLRR